MRIDVGLSQSAEFQLPVPAGRALVVVPSATRPTSAAPLPSKLQEAAGGVDIRRASPRQVVDLGLDLHLAGYLDWDEYAMLAFQPELHPDFDRTIGALTGERASPDRPRDYLSMWEDRLAFENRYAPKDTSILTRSERIVSVFRLLDRPMNLVA